MDKQSEQIKHLLQKLEELSIKQATFSNEIEALRQEIHQLQAATTDKTSEENPIAPRTKTPIKTGELLVDYVPPQATVPVDKSPKAAPKVALPEMPKLDWEKFIGENLISKIGIFITILGVGIGAKYSIDNDLISPLTRIIMGYLFGTGLLGLGIRLKENYTNYSAVLVSGAIAIFYFITYFAYAFYGLIPQLPAFGLMVIFTIFSVVAAIHYNQQIIALIGLVGAYGVPFLLGDGSGAIHIMFTYMAIINAGILVIAFKKYWKNVHRVAFILTWLIYSGWFLTDYSRSKHFGIALAFASIFFLTFYLLFLAYKLLKKEAFARRDIWLLLTNSFLFYGFGYAILEKHDLGEQFLGLFTLGNAAIHFVVSNIIYRQKLADKNLFYLVVGLVLLFLTMAIPVQLDGNWVTLIWVGEAALLFWIGRTKGVAFYEKLAYPLMLIAVLSLLDDWSNYSSYYVASPESRIIPIFNIYFLTSILFIAALGFINWLNRQPSYSPPNFKRKWIPSLFKVLIPGIFLVVLYLSVHLEIDNYFTQLYKDSAIGSTPDKNILFQFDMYNENLFHLKNIWLIIYAFCFSAALTIINAKWIQNRPLAIVHLGLKGILVLIFLTGGLFSLQTLQQNYLSQATAEYYTISNFNIIIRYIALLFFGGFLFITYRYFIKDQKGVNLTVIKDLVLYTILLVITSSEVIYWVDMNMGAFNNSNKLGLSILWGIYALFLITLGIWKRKKHLRITAIILFGITLVKLFFYDLSHLSTIAKTIVLVSLGLLLLLISFLYNKYKHLIADELEN